jgi:phosphomannomutase
VGDPWDRLSSRVRAWVDDDPDPATSQELRNLLEAAEHGDLTAVADLEDRFAGMLEFGTAGLRGALGGGPNRMNRAVVQRAAAGLVAYLQTDCAIPEPMVVVGFDARYNSDVFARDTAAVVVGAGGSAAILPRPLPTPVLAFAIRHLGADAGVMVTASHNPPQDNGYKVYLGDGSQIVPPTDAQIASHIAAVASVRDLWLAEDGWQNLGDEVQDAYVDGCRPSSRPTRRATSRSCTPRCTASATTRCAACSPLPAFQTRKPLLHKQFRIPTSLR